MDSKRQELEGMKENRTVVVEMDIASGCTRKKGFGVTLIYAVNDFLLQTVAHISPF